MSPLSIDKDLGRSLGRLPEQLALQCPWADPEHIKVSVDRAAAEVVELAHFPDFVPLLIQRKARERLWAERELEPDL